MIPRIDRRLRQLVCLLVGFLALSAAARAATLPAGFREALVAGGLSNPTAMQFAPDGRLFVAEQGGRLRVIKDGRLLASPFLTVTVNSAGERGLLGIAFDPNFATNRFVYVYYTAPSPAIHNRISRFTANGDVALAGSEVVIFELDNLSGATNHNGGALAFGADGKLYAAVGENATPSNAQSMNNLLGKILRINKDGTIPADNPFYGSTAGRNRAIWALGLRNPFTFAFNPVGTELFINDVGQNAWEEINDGIAGANYGWPETEGATPDPRFASPVYTYSHATGGCAITGGVFYAPLTTQFPADYVRDYFFADYCGGWIRKLDPAARSVVTFATGISAPVDLKVSDDGSLYYLARGAGAVYRVDYGAAPPSITSHPADRTVPPGAAVTFSVRASGAGPLRYQWQRNGANIAGATAQDFTIGSAASTDNGARFRAVVANDFGSTSSAEAVLTIAANATPSATITQPVSGTVYSGGVVINYAGTATDPEDGTLPASAFTWRVDFHHDAHTHPVVAPTSGSRTGSFTVPAAGETSANVWYRISLTVRDSGGLTRTSQRDVLPRKVRLTFATSPPGLQLRLDGQPVTTPLAVDAVAGITRTLGAISPQAAGGTVYDFVSWSDGGAPQHNVSTPAVNTTYTATFRAGASGSGNGLAAVYHNNIDFTGTVITRIDPVVNFVWGAGSPAAAIGGDTFSARWTGEVEAPITASYTFYTRSDDGVRLWVNGVRLVDNWTNHSATENRGTISLIAGRRYPIQMDYYENTGGATAALLWSATGMAKAAVPATRLYSRAAPAGTLRINFQVASAPVPAGYLPDAGHAYGPRAGGHTYGWNVDNTAQMRDRNAGNSPDQRYDTLAYMQKPANANASWEIALADGRYRVRVVAGDPSFYGGSVAVTTEGILNVSGSTTSGVRWLDGTAEVTVSDGRLTIRNGAGATSNKICFLEITPLP
jgi:glucose/arabinose dehydrogenase